MGWTQYRDRGPTGPSGLSRTLELDDVLYKNESWDGEGMVILPGPRGPLSTLHFEAITAGLEDYELYVLLKQLSVGSAHPPEALTVPQDLVSYVPACLTVEEFCSAAADVDRVPALAGPATPLSDDPAQLARQRRRLFAAVHALQHQE